MKSTLIVLGVSAGLVVALGGCQQPTAPATSEAPTPAEGMREVPVFEYDETWPKLPLPNRWITGTVVGVDVDSQDHIWIA